MKDFNSLKILDKFSKVFAKMGIDYKILRKLLWLKLLMDSRRVPTMANNYQKKDQDSNFFLKSLITYGLMGIMVMVIVITDIPIFIKMNLCMGIIIFMIMSSLIADFSSVLLDLKDKNILMTKPIDPKVINLAKILHITIYLTTVTLVVAGPSLIAGTIKHGLVFFFLFLFNLLMSMSFIIVLTTLLYFLILKFYDGEKLKDIINYFQIVLTIAMIIGYQLIGRMYDILDFEMVFKPKAWIFLLPSSWFSASFEILLNKNFTFYFIALGVLGLIIPIITVIIHIKYVLPYFEQYMSKLVVSGKGKVKGRRKLSHYIGKLIAYDKDERSFYNFTNTMLSNERKIKLRIYPNLAMSVIFPFIFVFNIGLDFDYTKSNAYMLIYMSIWFLSMLMNMITGSDSYKGSWIYKALPIESPTYILKGAFKGFFVKYTLPVFIIVSGIFLTLYHFTIIDQILLIFLNLILISIIMFSITVKEFPFSTDIEDQKKDYLPFITSIICIGTILGIHFLSKSIRYGIFINCIVAIIAIIILWKKGFQMKAFNQE